MNIYLHVVAVILTFPCNIVALQAPYILSVKPLSSNTIAVKWRNNDVSTQGFIILCKKQSENQFSIKKTVTVNTDSTNDSVLMPKTTYYYAIKCFNGSDTSDISNIDSATTLNGIFVQPELLVGFDEVTFRNIFKIIDKSEVNRDMYIYKSLNGIDFSVFKKIEIQSPLPNDTITVIDSGINPNRWYEYFVREISGTDSVSSYKKSLFTLQYQTLLSPDKDTVLTLGEKLNDFPVKYKAWSMKTGDTILLDETGLGDSECSIINIKDPSKPKYEGTFKSNEPIGKYKCGTSFNNTLWSIKDSAISGESGVRSFIDKFVYSDNNFHFSKRLALIHKPGENFCCAYWSFNHKTFAPTDSNVFIVSTADLGMGHTYSIASLYNFYNDTCQRQVSCGGDKCSVQIVYCKNTFFQHVKSYFSLWESYQVISEQSSTWAERPQFDSSKIPQKVGRFYTFEPAITNSKNTIIDEANSLAIVFSATVMSIYRINTGVTTHVRKLLSDNFQSKVKSKSAISKIDIYNSLGKKICTIGGNERIQMETKLVSYSQGVYIVACRVGNTIVSTKKFVR
jgi:hypothetical protein